MPSVQSCAMHLYLRGEHCHAICTSGACKDHFLLLCHQPPSIICDLIRNLVSTLDSQECKEVSLEPLLGLLKVLGT